MLLFPPSREGLILIVLSASLSALPDIDLEWQRRGVPIQHRGPTHTLLAALVAGLVFGLVFWYGGGAKYGALGLVSGFMGVACHLVGDAFTHHAFKPLWPLSQWEVALHLTSAGNRAANEGLATLGSLALVGYVLRMGGAWGALFEILGRLVSL